MVLEAVGELSDLAHRGAQGVRDPADGAPRWIRLAALDQREGAGSDAGLMRKGFLR